MHLTISHPVPPRTPSTRAALVMDHFGIDFETTPHTIAENLELPIQPRDIVCFTGPSGSGKSSLMHAAAARLDNVLDADSLDLGQRPLIDTLDIPEQPAMQLLAQCGLGEARLLLRTPAELSDGQRYRFRIALALSKQPDWLLADEFTATLDRTLAKVVAHNLHKLAHRTGTGLLLATTHEDILSDLAPTLHVHCDLDSHITPTRYPRKKKVPSPSGTTSTSPPAPSPTGRTSLGGITDPTTSASPASSPSSGMTTSRSASACSPPPPSHSAAETTTSASPPAGHAPCSAPSTSRS